MAFTGKNLLLYAVTEKYPDRDFFVQIESALKGGITCLQLREKHLSKAEFIDEARIVKRLCEKYSVPLIINDDVEVALESGADGVHIGQDDGDVAEVRKIAGSRLIIGVSAHNVEEALAAEKAGADYLGCGAVFGSTTKSNVHVLPLETLKNIAAAVKIPIVAIGGINETNMMQLLGTGINGVAVISAIFGAADIESKCQELKRLSEKIVSF
ncbi:thiamine phosphate synthase [bacterium]|nr:thiamine phosphate synthase [bacterium]